MEYLHVDIISDDQRAEYFFMLQMIFIVFCNIIPLSTVEVEVNCGKIPVDVPDGNKRPDTISNIIGTMAESKSRDGEVFQALTTGSST